ncbi:LysM peptidoglycan-binding domain-containing protein [Nitrosomonas sp. HPC101]|uniref:peptidoglycan DD-metalloendopeptidase family protein n=1 Tax=Nitrosomonas sp. HPC101 TaxID=1658667 RepID=UPI001368A075|nr:peptidoglycan DD-metalloendopeptidase family protein [Nitrosomonas sp. HPC101]MXS85265.1 LysM peptidoglycan-binding domain-containing protein [Nitrosomonas sp. HPC101]
MQIILLFLTLFLGACVSKPDPSPVVERQLGRYPDGGDNGTKNLLDRKVYIVQSGDTLYSIALRHGLDVNHLAEMNRITDPRELRVGQELYLQPLAAPGLAAQQESLPSQPALFSISQPEVMGGAEYQLPDVSEDGGKASESFKTEPKGVLLPYSNSARDQLNNQSRIMPDQKLAEKNSDSYQASRTESTSINVNKSGINWGWPTNGKIISRFSEKSKGVGISGSLKQPVLASASGTVVYSGNGLRGYGNLIIIKHNDSYLSAYGHNSKIFVHEGESVSKGQKIAEMGNADSGVIKLHFEIREKGKPVDPLGYLPVPQ